MPAALRSSSATTYGSRTNTTITAPSGIVDGDVLILMFIIAAGTTPPTPTMPAGFTVAQGPATQSDAGGFQVTRRLAYKVASGESGNYTVTHASASTDGMIICVSGADVSTLVSTSNGSSLTTAGPDTITALGVTTTTNGALVAYMVHNWDLWGTGTAPTGSSPTFTENLDSASNLVYLATGVLATAGATGDKTNYGLNATNEPWGAFLVAVGPSASNPPVGKIYNPRQAVRRASSY